MFKLLVCCTLAVVISAHPHAQDSQAEASYWGASDYSDPHSSNNFASNAELTSLAHTSAIQAKNLVQNQLSAGSQAAFDAKNSLAQAVHGAATTAQAALVSKQITVNDLQQQLQKSQHQLHQEIAQYHQAQQAAQAAQEASQQAHQQVHVLQAALSAAQATAAHTTQAAAGAVNAASSQHSMILEAKQKIESLGQQLQIAVQDLKETEAAAQKAVESAKIAQSNANAAAAKVGASSGGSYGGHYIH